jgi:outer membrane protein
MLRRKSMLQMCRSGDFGNAYAGARHEENEMKGYLTKSLAAAACAASLVALPAAAQDTKWMARVRAIDVEPNATSSLAGLNVEGQWTGELDFTYFFTKNIAAELILATTKHEVTLNGASLGDVWVLPPTLLLQYHFTDLGAFKPYVGGGLNVTWFYDVNLNAGPAKLTVDSTSVGGALQVGLDYEIAKNWVLNADVKYIWMSTDVYAGGGTLTDLKINPWVYGIGVGYRF